MGLSLQMCMYSQARKGTQSLLALCYTLDMLPERTKATKEKRALGLGWESRPWQEKQTDEQTANSEPRKFSLATPHHSQTTCPTCSFSRPPPPECKHHRAGSRHTHCLTGDMLGDRATLVTRDVTPTPTYSSSRLET